MRVSVCVFLGLIVGWLGVASQLQAGSAGQDAVARKIPAAPLETASRIPAQNSKGSSYKQAWEMLTDAVDSDNVRNRSDAVSALSLLDSDPRGIRLVVEELQHDKESSIRALAATSLGEMKARSAIPALREAMEDASPVVSFAAAKSLWTMGDRSGRGLFYDVLAGERKTVPGMVQRHIDQIKKDVHDPKALTLIGINEASGAFLGPFAMGVSMAEEYAKDTSAPAEALCAMLLSADNTPDTVERLSLALSDNDWAVRAAAAKALAKMNLVEMLPQLTEMMNTDKDQPARLVAGAAVIRLKDRHRVQTSPVNAPVSAGQLQKP